MSLFIPITKVDVARRLVYGTLSEEIPDKAGEILDYATAKPAFREWSRQFEQASGGRSLGNVRAMHGAVAAGKFTDISFDDENRRICGVAKIVDDDEWNKVLEGVYTGFSIGGGYARRWPDTQNPALMRYTPVLSEVSLVDNPAVPTATFEVVKQDGSVECRKFNQAVNGNIMLKEIRKDDAQSHIETLLGELEWLAGHIADEEEADGLVPHIDALRDYLTQETEEDTSQGGTAKMRKTAARDTQALLAAVEQLQKRVVQLEAQPQPPRGVLRAIGKAEDRAESVQAQEHASPSAQRAHELMKLALSQPIVF